MNNIQIGIIAYKDKQENIYIKEKPLVETLSIKNLINFEKFEKIKQDFITDIINRIKTSRYSNH